MRNRIIKLVLNIILWCLPFVGFAQISPISVTTTLTPPYSLTLSDYTKMGAQNLVVTVMVNDVSITNLPVRLHLKIETTAGITIENTPVMTTIPIYLSGGQVSVLFGNDLTDYFNVNNLQFKGYSREEYRRTGQLPEGFYRFSVEIRHFETGRVISRTGTAMAWIALGKPPLLKSPLEGTEMGTIAGMPLTFLWQPASLGVPNAGLQYTFEMWEMRTPGISPYVVAASMPVFHSVTQSNTVLTIHPASLFLEPGMQYAWRITASDPAGLIPFAENGQSEIRTFIYQSKCDCVNDFTINQRGRDATIQWKSASNQTSFYVEVENPDTDYYNRQQVFNNRLDLHGLEAGKTYNIRVQAVCNNNEENSSDFTAWKSLSIAENKPIQEDCPDCGCDTEFHENSITNFELRKDLQPGDIIVTPDGSTRYILKTVEQQGDGIYKGIFLLWWEYYRVKILCEYWDLSVNTDNVIVNFDFKSVYNPQFLLDVDAAKKYLDNLTETISKGLTTTEIKDSLKISGPIEDIYVDKNGDVVIVNGNDTTRLDDNFNGTLIQGEDGKEYVATSNGKVMGVDEYKATGGNSYKQDEYNKEKESKAEPSVKFTASKGQQYGFDEYTEQKNALQNDYPELKAGYRLAFKSIPSYKTDKVGISGANKETSFRTEWGVPVVAAGNELTIRGAGNGDETILYAYNKQDSTETVAGKLNILSFDELNKKVYLVSVNGAKLPTATNLREELNKIYAPAVTKWQVQKATGIQVDFDGGKFTHGGSSAIAVYNADQKKTIKAYEAVETMEKDALYLFFVDNVKGRDATSDYIGYMPLAYQSGFIYGLPSENWIAHELAHGAFNLYHTFTSGNNFIAAQNTTDNLMDYKGGTELWKYQWLSVHNPQNVFLKFLQEEEEGELAVFNGITWLGNFLWGLAPDKQEKEIEDTQGLFNHIHDNYDDYFEKSKTGDIALINSTYSDWSVRLFSHKEVVCKSIYKKLAEDESPVFNLRKKGIFVENYTLEDKNYKVGVYSFSDKVTLNSSNIKLGGYKDLADNVYVKAGYTKKYGIIVFYDDAKNPLMLLQIIGSEPKKDVTQWLNYLAVVVNTKEQEKKDKEIWNKLNMTNLMVYALVKLNSIWGQEEIVSKNTFVCSKCGRDLMLTHEKLIDIFGNDSKITMEHVEYFNNGLKNGEFNTCKRQAHFFSQISVESQNFKDLEEDFHYRLYLPPESGIYATFNKQTNGCHEILYNQDFWDNNSHLDYISTNKCQHRYSQKDTADIAKDKRYKAEDNYVLQHANKIGFSITIPQKFVKDTTGIYMKNSIADLRKNGENLFNLVYKNMNGNVLEGDGWKYRGRGALQVTGRGNYKATSNKCNALFGTNYDWENNPDDLMTEMDAIIYSAICWFLINIPMVDLDNNEPDYVTKKVNAAKLKANERQAMYINLMNKFNCDDK